MFGIHRAGHCQLAPHERRRRFGGRIQGAFAQDNGRDVRPLKTGEARRLAGPVAPALPERKVVELPALAADHRLDFAMQAFVCTAGDPYAVLTLRTFEEIRFAHVSEIQRGLPKNKQRFSSSMNYEG